MTSIHQGVNIIEFEDLKKKITKEEISKVLKEGGFDFISFSIIDKKGKFSKKKL